MNLFTNKAYLQKNLEKRNLILWRIRITMWIGLFLSIVAIFAKTPIQPEWYWVVIMIIFLITYFRFETWLSPYWARLDSDSGTFLLKDHLDGQTKFFTFRVHKQNNKNPLW